MPTDWEWPSSSFFPHLNHISSRFSRSLWELRFDLVSLQLPADALYVSLRSFSHPHRTFLFKNETESSVYVFGLADDNTCAI